MFITFFTTMMLHYLSQCLMLDDIVFGESNRIKRYFMAWHRFPCCQKRNNLHQKIYSTEMFIFSCSSFAILNRLFYDVLIKIQIMYSITLHHSKRIYPKLIQSRLIYRNGKEETKTKTKYSQFQCHFSDENSIGIDSSQNMLP